MKVKEKIVLGQGLFESLLYSILLLCSRILHCPNSGPHFTPYRTYTTVAFWYREQIYARVVMLYSKKFYSSSASHTWPCHNFPSIIETLFCSNQGRLPFIIYLSRVLCLCVCVSQFVSERSAILLVLLIKLTQETRQRDWRGRDQRWRDRKGTEWRGRVWIEFSLFKPNIINMNVHSATSSCSIELCKQWYTLADFLPNWDILRGFLSVYIIYNSGGISAAIRELYCNFAVFLQNWNDRVTDRGTLDKYMININFA
jgi:hypothetical protein